MSDAVEQKVLDLFDKGGAALGQFSDKLVELGKQYGPDVLNGALEVARIDAANGLVIPVVGTIIFSFLAWKAVPPILEWRTRREDEEAKKPFSADAGFITAGAVALIVAITAPLIICLINVLDIWRWVGIFEPKIWIAKKVLGL